MTTQPTVAAVRTLVTTTMDDPSVQSFIDDATVTVGPCSLGIDCATLTVIIKYVAAHLIALSRNNGAGTLTSKKLGDASEAYTRTALGTGLSETSYGQSALNMDPTGCLANLGKRRGFAKLL